MPTTTRPAASRASIAGLLRAVTTACDCPTTERSFRCYARRVAAGGREPPGGNGHRPGLTLTLRQLLPSVHGRRGDGLVDQPGLPDVRGQRPDAALLRRDRAAAAGVDRRQRLPVLRARRGAAPPADPR